MNTRSLAILCCSVVLAACQQDDRKAPHVSFANDVRPILEQNCVNCHCAAALAGELNMENKAMAFRQRKNGPAIIPGNADSSPLYKVLTLPDSEKTSMPPKGHRLPTEEMKTIHRWINQGAEWPEGADGVVQPAPFPQKHAA